MSENIEIGNLYDLNKDIMKKAPPLTSKEIEDKKFALQNFFSKENGHYYMLLCNEQKDYTVFHLSFSAMEGIPSFVAAAEEVIECLKNRGKILAIDYMEETGAYECWIRRSGMSYMYALFPYDAAVIEC